MIFSFMFKEFFLLDDSITQLEALLYNSIISYIFLVSLVVPSRKRRTSSTNNCWERNKTLPILTPFKAPNLLASFINLHRPSTSSENNKGERGHLCLKPIDGLQTIEADSFMRTAKDTNVMTHIFHLTT